MPSNFIHQRHAAYQTPPALLFALIRQTTGDEPSHSEKLVRGYDNEVYAVQTQQGHDYIVRIQQQGVLATLKSNGPLNAAAPSACLCR